MPRVRSRLLRRLHAPHRVRLRAAAGACTHGLATSLSLSRARQHAQLCLGLTRPLAHCITGGLLYRGRGVRGRDGDPHRGHCRRRRVWEEPARDAGDARLPERPLSGELACVLQHLLEGGSTQTLLLLKAVYSVKLKLASGCRVAAAAYNGGQPAAGRPSLPSGPVMLWERSHWWSSGQLGYLRSGSFSFYHHSPTLSGFRSLEVSSLRDVKGLGPSGCAGRLCSPPPAKDEHEAGTLSAGALRAHDPRVRVHVSVRPCALVRRAAPAHGHS